MHSGPFAFLVRPIIFQSRQAGNHDYLGIPEIVEDICLSYEEMYGHSLRERFLEASRPCIVKFRTGEWTEDRAVQAALMFVHCELTSQPHEIFHVCVLAGIGFHWKFIHGFADGTISPTRVRNSPQ